MQRFAFALTSIAIAAASQLAAAQTLGKYGAAFKSDRGLTVEVAPTLDDKSALVRLHGINHPIDDVVFLADKVVQGQRMSLRTTLDGRPWSLVVTQNHEGWLGGYSATQAYLPGQRDGVHLRYDEAGSKALQLDALLQTYQKQKSKGVQEQLAQFDRAKSVAHAEAQLREADEAATRACGVPVRTTVAWSSINEDQMKRLSIGGYCAAVANAGGQLCGSSADFKSRAASLASISCQFGDKLRLARQGEATVFTTTESAGNQQEFALQYLRNQ